MDLMHVNDSHQLLKAGHKWYSRLAKSFLLFFDLLLINILFIIFNEYFEMFYLNAKLEASFNTIIPIFNLTWIGLAIFNELYKIDGLTKSSQIFLKLLVTAILYSLLTSSFIYANYITLDWFKFSLFFLSTFVSITSFRFLMLTAYRKYKNSNSQIRNVIIIGQPGYDNVLYNFFKKNYGLGYRFKGFFDKKIERSDLDEFIAEVSQVKEFCCNENIDEIYYTGSLDDKGLINDIAEFADEHFIYFRIVPDFNGIVDGNLSLYFYDNIPVLTTRQEPLRVLINRIIKRGFDIVFSLAVILLIFPFILPVISLIIKLESRGPIFFKQLRPGYKNQLFACYKFRTMRINKTTELQATKDDPRITRFGKIMRKTSIDELPQFFNVLLGDMSVVGPRPNMVKQLEYYSEYIKKYSTRHFIKPGITGYAQVNGYRGETKELSLMIKRVEYDMKYIENWSLLLDCKIIFLTVWNMVKGEKNAY